MTDREVGLWFSYRHKYGPLSPVRKYDQGAALVCSQINRSNGGKAVPKDFMPYGKDPESDRELTEQDFMALVGKGAKIGR
jgi:hypothetical protein